MYNPPTHESFLTDILGGKSDGTLDHIKVTKQDKNVYTLELHTDEESQAVLEYSSKVEACKKASFIAHHDIERSRQWDCVVVTCNNSDFARRFDFTKKIKKMAGK